jgi:folate-dependent phosphoribosylglycinamide formyltransferase PurN
MVDKQDFPESKICVVTAGGPYAWIIANALIDHFGPVDVIQEQPEPMGLFLRRRARKQGWISVGGQFITMVIGKLGKKSFSARLTRMVEGENLQPEPRENQRLIPIETINSDAFVSSLADLKTKVVLLVGTRLIKAHYIERITKDLNVTLLNYHAGITPQYRGMNGGYWSLVNDDAANFGATIHLVDQGVDTGSMIAQVRTEPAENDNIMTYAHRLAAASRGICVEAVADALENKLVPIKIDAPSRQWYHPPIWTYLWNGLTKKIW